MKIAIVGFDTEGRATYEYFTPQGHDITICDQNPDVKIPDGVDSSLGQGYLDGLDRFDLIVRTAGMHPRLILEKNPGTGDKITTHINEFMKACPTRNIIGITGTKGKGTTSSLTTEILKAAGLDVFLGGNIGVPPLTFLDKLRADSYVVLELSSFQLIDLRTSPHVAVCLMVVPEHLNWHEDFEEYIAAKQQLFIHQAEDDLAIYHAKNENSISIADASLGKQIPYLEAPGAYVASGEIIMDGEPVCKLDELKLLGKHNWQNACAAVTAAWQYTTDRQAMRSALTTFSGLPHRLEFVREHAGIRYYDDSFGTTPETAIVALEAFPEPKVAILGGSDKGADFTELAKAVKNNNVRRAVVIGDTGPAIAAALRAQDFNAITEGGGTMEEIIAAVRQHAEPGDVVLLSTGCASFGLFENYKDRGEQFKRAVQALA